jgi:hypothetical protein
MYIIKFPVVNSYRRFRMLYCLRFQSQAVVTYSQAVVTYSQAVVTYSQAVVTHSQAVVTYSQALVTYSQEGLLNTKDEGTVMVPKAGAIQSSCCNTPGKLDLTDRLRQISKCTQR